MYNENKEETDQLSQRSVMLSDLFRCVKRKRQVQDENSERVYTAHLSYESTVNCRFKGEANIHWRIKNRRNHAMNESYSGLGVDLFNCTYPATFVEKIRGCFSKHLAPQVTVGGKFKTNFLAMLRHAGACMANYCLSGQLNVDILSKKKHKDTHITMISDADSLSLLSRRTLYLPNSLRSSDIGIFNVVYLLGAATDADIAMDNIVIMDGHQRFTVREGTTSMWAHDLHNAIFYMLGLSDACGAGDMAALALTAGLHSVYTVVGHSDEGGLMRDVLRGISFVPSYGVMPPVDGIHFCQANVMLNQAVSWDAMSGLWDYVAVATAGLVHISDPCMDVCGDPYPTIVTAKDQASSPQSRLLGGLVDVAPKFFKIYSKNLCTFFATEPKHIEDVVSVFMSSLMSIVQDGANTHHLPEGNILAPWYWVESSGLFSDLSVFDSPTTINGLGPQALDGAAVELPATEGAVYNEALGIYDVYSIPWTTARRNPIFTLLNNKKGDGVANVDFSLNEMQQWLLDGQPSRRTCKDKTHGTAEAKCGHTTPNRDSLDEYLWGRVSCHLMHPAELTSFNDVLIRVKAWHVDNDGDVWPTRMPDREVFEGTIIVKMNGVRLIEAHAGLLKVPAVARQYQSAARYLSNMKLLGGEGPIDHIFGGGNYARQKKMYKAEKGKITKKEQIISVSQMVEPTQEVSKSRTGNTYRTNLSVWKAAVTRDPIPGIEFRGREKLPEIMETVTEEVTARPDTSPDAPRSEGPATE